MYDKTAAQEECRTEEYNKERERERQAQRKGEGWKGSFFPEKQVEE